MNPHLIIKGQYKGAREPIEVYCTLCGGISYPYAEVVKNHKMSGCAVCMGKIVQSGINDLWTTAPEIAKCGNKKYDFYIENNNIIIETHGKQHYYEGNFTHKGARTLQEEQINDKIKEDIAIKNGIEYYIILDCRESTIEWIKNSIVNSKLNVLYDLSSINWEECSKYATSSKIEEAAKLWNNGLSTGDIKDIMHISATTIIDYLNKAVELKMCDYNKKESSRRGTIKRLNNQN